MRWWVFVPLALLCVLLDMAFMPVVSIAGFQPSLTAVLLAFVALHASPRAALAGALVVGLYADAQPPAVFEDGALPVFGPHMVAAAVAVWAVLQVREVLFLRNALTVAAAALAVALGQALVFLAVAGLRVAYADPSPLWGSGTGARAFGHSAVDAVYTAVLALPLAWVLMRTIDAWGFQQAGPRFGRR